MRQPESGCGSWVAGPWLHAAPIETLSEPNSTFARRSSRRFRQTAGVELGLFDQVADALRALVPGSLGDLRTQERRWGLKAWFDADDCPREHYEAQVINAAHVPGADVLAVEVGFHAEHPKAPDNAAAMGPLLAAESRWRPELGPEAEAGDFLGRGGWQRVSEAWPDPDLSDPEICFEIADRLATYITALEPQREP